MALTPASYQTPYDICNSALQELGVRQISTFADASVEASAMSFRYDKVRMAELQRNNWTFSRRVAPLRAVETNATQFPLNLPASGSPSTGTLMLTPQVWNPAITYLPGSIVADPNVPGLFWTSTAFENINNPPGEGSVWDVYFGPLTVTPFDLTQSYWAGELVYITDPNSQVVRVFRSMMDNNGVPSTAQTVIQTVPNAGLTQTTVTTQTEIAGTGNPWVVSEWNAAVTYNRDAVVGYEFTLYRSATEQNMGNVPATSAAWIACGPITAPTLAVAASLSWLPIQAAVSSIVMPYPIGSGPAQDPSTRNAFRLPNGYLRKAPQHSSDDMYSYLGRPSNPLKTDWRIEGSYLTSRDQGPILFAFIADITAVTKMEPMFCEGVALRLAVETCQQLTGKTEMLPELMARYARVMGEARIINMIENGPDPTPLDDYIACRA